MDNNPSKIKDGDKILILKNFTHNEYMNQYPYGIVTDLKEDGTFFLELHSAWNQCMESIECEAKQVGPFLRFLPEATGYDMVLFNWTEPSKPYPHGRINE